MPDIVDPAAIQFVSSQIRPLAEEARALKARITAMSTDWFGGMNILITNTPDPVVDGRAAEGINGLTGADVNSAVGDLINAASAINDEIIAKPCVRPLNVSVP